MLNIFKPNGKICNWPGCNREAGNTSLDVIGKTTHCLHHHLKKYSGRVGGTTGGNKGTNWQRDHYREHMNPDSIDYAFCKRLVEKHFPDLDWKTKHWYVLKCFDVDHIDGDHYNNDPSNLQTLTKIEHILKSMKNGDLNGHR